MTYLAVPIAARDLKGASEQIALAKKAQAEMLELRTDYLTELSVALLKEVLTCAAATKLPIIVTCRDKAEGGKGNWPIELRSEILIEALKAGADFIDCEYANFLVDDVRSKISQGLSAHKNARLILSAHDFDGPFSDPAKVYEDIMAIWPEAIAKLAYKAGHINDCFEAFDLLGSKAGDAIVLCMGPAGLISRPIAKNLGGFAVFASVNEENATAPGQVTIQQMKALYRWDSIDSATEFFGVIGSPVGHSLSPAIFNACFDADGINAVYLPCLVEGDKAQFDKFMDNIVSRVRDGIVAFGGFSVTLPHKAVALDYIRRAGDSIEPLAVNIGAVNTLKIGLGGIVTGYNTDYSGAMDALVSAMDINKHGLHDVAAAVIGAGGAARAVVAGLADVGARITIYNRTLEKARSLAKEFACEYAELAAMSEMTAKIVVNCTSIGMYPDIDATAVPAECLDEDMVVFDTVYNPLRTQLLKDAADAGAKTINGAEMFVRQAMAQFKLFIGTEANEEVMRKTVFDCLS